MPDSNFPQQVQQGGSGWQSIKLRDLGDGTYAISHMNMAFWEKTHIAGAATTVVKNSPGNLQGLMINKAVSLSSITIYDNTSATGTLVGIITHPLTLLNNQYFIPYRCRMDTGITVVTSAADDLTILWM